MFREHASFHPPDDRNASVWRYMSFPKFVDLIDQSSLFFTRAGRFDDAWEGAMPLEVSFPRQQVTEEQENILRRDSYNFLQTCCHLNCWHLSEAESLAMWRIYGGDGVAVRSTYQRMVDAVGVAPEEIRIGTVSYGQMRPADYTLYSQLLWKRQSFAYEQEIRMIVDIKPEDWTSGSFPIERYGPEAKPGVPIAVHLSTLVERVYVAPGQAGWFKRLVERTTARYGLDVEVIISDIDSRPDLK